MLVNIRGPSKKISAKPTMVDYGLHPEELFQGGKNGVIFLPRFSKEESTGQNNATVDGNIGMILDSHAGLKRGPELNTGDVDLNGDATDNGDGTYTVINPGSVPAYVEFNGTAGGWREVTFTTEEEPSEPGNASRLYDGNSTVSGNLGDAKNYRFIYNFSSDIRIYATLDNQSFILKNVSIRELPGHHATQATGIQQGKLRQTAGGVYYIELDGADDFYSNTSQIFSGDQDFIIGIASIDEETSAASSGRIAAISVGTVATRAGVDLGTTNEEYTATIGGAAELTQNTANNVNIIQVFTKSGLDYRYYEGSNLSDSFTDSSALSFGAGVILGQRYDTGTFLKGKIFAAIAVADTPTNTKVSNIQRWLHQQSRIPL